MSFIPPSYNINKNLSNFFDTHINGLNWNTEPFYNSFDFCNKNIGLFSANGFSSSYTNIESFGFTSAPNFTNQVSYTPWDSNYSPQINITNMFNAPSWNAINTQFDSYLNNFGFNNISFSNTPTFKTTFNQISNSTLTASGNKVPDGTNLTIKGVDYSIFGSEASKIKQLRPQMQLNMEKLFKYANNKGWKISITSGFRSTEKQRQLYNTPGVYAAKPGSSRHEYGCAVDLKVNGSSKNEETKELGRYALSLGMRWGGTWAYSKNEPWHFDINPKTTQTGTEYVAVNNSNSKQFLA